MDDDRNLAGEIPAYLNKTLPPDRKDAVEKKIEQSEQMRSDLEFWRKTQRYFQFEKSVQVADHPSPESILDYCEGRVADDSVKRHLNKCKECRALVGLLEETYGIPADLPQTVHQSIFDHIRNYFSPPTIPRYAIGFGLVAVIAILIAYIMIPRDPEWQQLLASADQLSSRQSYVKAEQTYHDALIGIGPDIGSHPLEVTHILDSLAVINERAGELKHAEDFFNQSLTIREQQTLEPDQSFPWVLERLGSLKLQEGDLLQAELFFRRADSARGELAARHPSDPEMGGYRRNIATLALTPPVIFRSPSGQHFPKLVLSEGITHVKMEISLKRSEETDIRFIPTLSTPSKKLLPIPDTLSVDATGKVLNLTLSRRYFTEGDGRYRLQIREYREPERGSGEKDFRYWFTIQTKQ